MDLTPFQVMPTNPDTYRARATTLATRLVVALAAVLLAMAMLASIVDRTPAPGLSGPRPLPAPGPVAANFPEQSHIASCWTLATVSNALEAPRSQQSSDIVGPLYADACQGA